MQNWLSFFIFIFWICLISFIVNFSNFVRLLFYSEIVWIILYCLVLIKGSINDDLNLISTSILILGLAGVEYSIGIILILLFKDVNKKVNFDEIYNDFSANINHNKNIYVNRYIWNKQI